MDDYSNTQTYIDFFLKKIRERPEYYLSPQERLEIYKNWGDFTKEKDIFDFTKRNDTEFVTLNLNTADKILANLAIITAKKVLPVCLETDSGSFIINDPDYSNSPFEMLEKAESLLKGRLNAATAWSYLIAIFWDGLISLEYSLNEKTSCAVFAAYSAFTITLLGFDSLEKPTNQNLVDSVEFSQRDFAAFAERAYASFDENAPGMWAKRNYGNYKNQYKPLRIDVEKRLEFWQWWLVEAIPQAWELAHKSE